MEAKRNKLVIIGNGFDLAHEFKTSYNDFILWYLNEFIELAFNKNNHDDSIMIAEGCGNNFERKLEERDVNSIKDFQDNYISKQKVGIKSDFFRRLISEDKEYNWIDIEKDYYKALIRFYNAFTQS
ncbi:MAG: hypothetical protein RLZZ306_2054, partial [Bacteroidota bacterium]